MTKRKALTQPSTLLKQEEVDRRWFLFDASGKTLGRLATELARVLRGKHRADFTPHTDSGDGVIVINVEKIRVTGSKAAQKMYYTYSGYQSGLKETSYRTMLERKPEYIIEHAVKGMLPKTKMGSHQLRRLRLFKGSEHDMAAQQPIIVNA